MNLEEEFKRAGSTPQEITEVIRDFVKQKYEIEKKIHIFCVVSFAREMAKFVNGQDLKSMNISAISYRHYRDFDSGGNNIMFELLDLNGHEIATHASDEMDEKQSEIYSECMTFLSMNGLMNVDIELINEEFTEKVKKSVSLLDGTEEQILDLFLNRELKATVDFHQMQMGLKNKNNEVRKPKI